MQIFPPICMLSPLGCVTYFCFCIVPYQKNKKQIPCHCHVFPCPSSIVDESFHLSLSLVWDKDPISFSCTCISSFPSAVDWRDCLCVSCSTGHCVQELGETPSPKLQLLSGGACVCVLVFGCSQPFLWRPEADSSSLPLLLPSSAWQRVSVNGTWSSLAVQQAPGLTCLYLR